MFGLMSLIAYTGVIIALWVWADLSGYTYFRGGEPRWYVKYAEWLAGIIGLAVAAEYLYREAKLAESKDF